MGLGRPATTKWKTVVSLGFTVVLGFAAWRIGSASDSAIGRVATGGPDAGAKADTAAPFQLSKGWKLGHRSWGDASDGDERDRRFVPPDDPDRKPEYNGLDVMVEGR